MGELDSFGRGIGAAIVKRLAREGSHVALTYVSRPEEANKTAAAAKATDKTIRDHPYEALGVAFGLGVLIVLT